jgi:glycerol uptake facilitator-like aquaporin
MKATSISPQSGQPAAGGSAVVFLHGHQLERNLARAVTAEAAGTFVLVLAIAVASLGHISGAHLNPAVTLGLTVNRHFPWAYAPGYVIAQFAGATAAAAATWGLYGNQARSIARLGATAPAAGISAERMLAAEAVVTFVLVLVVVAVATCTATRQIKYSKMWAQ